MRAGKAALGEACRTPSTMKGSVYLVAGVGSGLGTAVTALLASRGETVVAAARRAESLAPLEAHGRTHGWSLFPFVGDLSKAEDVDRLVRTTLREAGPLDGACLQTGRWVTGDPLLHKTTDREWTEGLQSNLEAIFRVGRAVLPLFLERRQGSLVLISAADPVRWSGNVAYCVAKGGLVDLAHKLARDYRPYGIRVNAVLPGNMEHGIASLDPPDPAAPIPLRDSSGRGAWEVARLVVYLLGREGRWITGAAIPVDGGRSTFAPEPTSSP